MFKQVSQTVIIQILMLTLTICAFGQQEFDITGRWIEQGGESVLEFTKEGGYNINFKPSLSDGSANFNGESYNQIDNSHLSFTIMVGKDPSEIIDVKVTIKKNKELRFKLEDKKYSFVKEAKPLFPDGIESITLISATISPEEITVDGSDLNVYFKNSDSIPMKELVPVTKIVTRSMTITTRTWIGGDGLVIKDDSYFTTSIANPRNTYYYSKGTLTGSGTIYIYLEDPGENADKEDDKRVSNILSVYATFK